MHPMLQKHVDSGYMKEEHGLYIEEAIAKGETLIISGHRSAGIRPFMAAIMAVAKGSHKTAQVKDEAGIEAQWFKLLLIKKVWELLLSKKQNLNIQ